MVMFGATPGPDPYLSLEEEEELASFLVQTAKIGYPHTKKQYLLLVQQIVDKHLSRTPLVEVGLGLGRGNSPCKGGMGTLRCSQVA